MTKPFETTPVFVIRQKSTGKTIKFGSKCGWASHGAACSAFHLHMKFEYPELEGTKKSLYWHQEDFYIEEIK